MHVLVTTRVRAEITVEAEIGLSLMEIIRNGGIDELAAVCGGCCSCATCHVHVNPQDSAKLPPPSENERDLLEGSDYRTATSRLSCQIVFTEELDELRVTIAPEE